MAAVDPTKPTVFSTHRKDSPDLTGQVFCRLTVTGFAGYSKTWQPIWNCTCECGGDAIASSYGLRSESKRSCGCLILDVTSARSITHGMTKSPEYQSWRSMIHRCENLNATGYENYGGRGITVCDRWRNSFALFFADMGKRPTPTEYHEIERKNNDGNYEPDNCIWATIKEQARNRRSGRTLTYNGRTLLIVEWAEVTGMKVGQIHNRLYAGWDIDRIFTQPVRKRSK